jgi:hypothetical protein
LTSNISQFHVLLAVGQSQKWYKADSSTGETKATISAKFYVNFVTPSIHRNALIPDRPDKKGFLSGSGFIPQTLPIKLERLGEKIE